MFSFISVKPAKPAPKEVRQAFIPVTAERTTTEAQATTEAQTATEAQSITTESPSIAMSNTLSTYPTGMNANFYKDVILDRLIL